MILAGDIGGTNTRLALFEPGRRPIIRARDDFKNDGQQSFEEIVERFLGQGCRQVKVACFGVAGPVKNGAVELTNMKWRFEAKKLKRSLRIPHVAVINDLVAHAEGIGMLRAGDIVTIARGKAVKRGNRAIIAPGTGLGEAGLVWDESIGDYRAIASEGGHCDFAPRDERQINLLRFVQKTRGRCSWEDLLSGPGLQTILDFVVSPGKFRIESSLGNANPSPEEISRAAAAGSCRACVAVLVMFCELLGSEAGNLALKFLATGGLWIGGGIAPHVVKFLRRPGFRESFTRKGANIHVLLGAIPIQVIKSPDNALYGAAHVANRQNG